MKKAMNTLQDLIEEAKVRTVWWALCVFLITYFLSHTSKSMWMNAPIALLLLIALRFLSHEVEFRWRGPPVRPQTYLSYLEKRQLSPDDSRLSIGPPTSRRKSKIDSPVVEAAVNEFINKILQDFVVDLWYSSITPDREFPEHIRLLVNDVLGEISVRVKDINLVDLLTRDIIDLVGKHLDLYRKNQISIGIEVMGTLSLEERDERLKHHLMASKELHPALVSPESEYKVLQRLVGGLLAVVLRPREAQIPLIRSIARELLTCLVMQPIMNLVSPACINELIEFIILNGKDNKDTGVHDDHLAGQSSQSRDHVPLKSMNTSEHSSVKSTAMGNQQSGVMIKTSSEGKTSASPLKFNPGDTIQSRPADWARVLEAATQRRSEVLAPENLENMWAKGRNYKAKRNNNVKTRAVPPSATRTPGVKSYMPIKDSGNEILITSPAKHIGDEANVQVTHRPHLRNQYADGVNTLAQSRQHLNKGLSLEAPAKEQDENCIQPSNESKAIIKRSNSTSALNIPTIPDRTFTSEGGGSIFSEFYSADMGSHKEEQNVIASDMVFNGEGIPSIPKLRCRVVGAYFEKIGSNSFAVYSIAVKDALNNTWFVKRRYRNFERLHRHLKDIPNYTLHLPPKRFLSSSIDDNFVHQRCIQLDQYLQDLLSIANVAEQHEVWDFLSDSSKSYSFGKSPSVMKTLAVNVDDAMDDILRQVKGVSGGLMRKVVGSASLPLPVTTTTSTSNMNWNEDEDSKQGSSCNDMETSHNLSDNEEHDLDESHDNDEVISSLQVNGWHSDNELNLKGVPPRVIKREQAPKALEYDKDQYSEVMSHMVGYSRHPDAISPAISGFVEDPVGVPHEWTPPNMTVPILNLVDKIFQLKRRGWLRRQVFWFSKQILQLVMDDAIDDWLLRQIHWLRRDDTIALGIHWIQDILWPNGKFFMKLETSQGQVDEKSKTQSAQASNLGSFELQLEAVRRASDVKKMILDGAPTALVSLIGNKQYKRCAKDVYYFLQSSICVKHLAYGVLELLLVSVFPELHDLVVDIHETM